MRQQYVSFFGDRRSRRRGPIGDRPPPRWPILTLVALAGVSLWYLLAFGDDPAPDPLAGGTPASVLRPVGSTTTIVDVVAEDVSCPVSLEDWEGFQGGPERLGCIEARTITEPVLLWTVEIGVQGWLNNPVVHGTTVYVGSAGSTQFEEDGADGVYALDLLTGEQRWFFPATFDVNGVVHDGDLVVAVGDEGFVWAIDATAGTQVWAEDLNTPVFGNPLVVGDLVVVGTGTGSLVALDLATGERRWTEQVDGPVRAGAASDGSLVFAAGENGDVIAVGVDGNAVWRARVDTRAPGEERIFAAPTVIGDLVVVTVVRDDVAPDPGVVALDRSTGSVRWTANDAAGIKTQWGNVRSSPAVVGDLLVYGEPYSNSLVAVGQDDGETRWAIEVGPFCYPHWPSPAVVSGQAVLARHDGGIYGIDLASGSVAWSVYLGDASLRGRFPEAFDDDFCEWQPVSGYSVLSSPAVAANGIVVAGTLEGYLMAIGDESW